MSLQRQTPGPAQRGWPTGPSFTLIELLVVIAIIAILASLLLPVLGIARTQARSAACLNNQKQLHLAALMYADDYADFVVPWRTTNGWYWVDYLRAHCPVDKKARTSPFVCPDDRDPYYYNNAGTMYVSYGIDRKIAADAYNRVNWTKVTRFADPSLVSLLLDQDSISEPVSYASRSLVLPTANGISITAFRHNSKINVLFVDGSVKTMTMDEVRNAGGVFTWY